MATYVLRDAKHYLGAYAIADEISATTITTEADDLDVTTFGSGGVRERVAGLRDATFELEGYADYAMEYAVGFASLDSIMRSNVGVSDTVFTVSPTDGTIGAPALFAKTVQGTYQDGGSVGEVSSFSATIRTSGVLAGGVILEPGSSARTSTGNGSSVQLREVAAGQYLYAVLHVLAVSGTSPSLTVAIQSDDNAGMSSATTRATFTAVSAIGAQWLTPVAGPLGGATEDYWRATWTISGTSPSFTFVVALAIA